MLLPTIVVERDFDDYFKSLVTHWCGVKFAHKVPFKHKVISINAMPFLPDAVTTITDGDTLKITFYSALRHGFGLLSASDIESIILLL